MDEYVLSTIEIEKEKEVAKNKIIFQQKKEKLKEKIEEMKNKMMEKLSRLDKKEKEHEKDIVERYDNLKNNFAGFFELLKEGFITN